MNSETEFQEIIRKSPVAKVSDSTGKTEFLTPEQVSKMGLSGQVPAFAPKPIYKTATGWAVDATKSLATPSVVLNEETGKITVDAPSEALANKTFRTSINDTLKTLSANYKINKNYKYNIVNAAGENEEKSIQDIIADLNKPIQNEDGSYNTNSLSYMVQAAIGIERTKAAHKKKSGVDLNDVDVMEIDTVAVGPDVKENTLQLISDLPEAGWLRAVSTYSPETGKAQYGDIMQNAYNKEKTSSEDMIKLWAALENYFAKGDYSDKEQYIKNVATARFLQATQPNMAWIRDVTENVTALLDGIGGFATNLGTAGVVAVERIGDFFGFEGDWEKRDAYYEMYPSVDASQYNAGIARGGDPFSTDPLLSGGQYWNKIGKINFDGNGVPTYDYEPIFGTFETPRTTGELLRAEFKKNQAIIQKDRAYLHASQNGWDAVGYTIANLATLISAGNALSDAFTVGAGRLATLATASGADTATALADTASALYASGSALGWGSTAAEAAQIVSGIKTIYDIAAVTGKAGTFLNFIGQAVTSAKTTEFIIGVVGESLAEAVVGDPDRLTEVLANNEVNADTKMYLIETYLGNAIGWGVGLGVGKFLIKAGDTTRGRAISANLSRRIFKIQDSVGEAFDQALLTIRRVKGDDLAEKIKTLYESGGKYAQKQANSLSANAKLREMREALIKSASPVKIAGQSTDEINKALNDIETKILTLQGAENALTSMQRQGMDIVQGWLKDKGAGMLETTEDFYSKAASVARLEKAAGDLFTSEKGAITNLSTGKILRLFSQTTTNYIKATEKIDFINAYIRKYEHAVDVTDDILRKIDGYRKELPELQAMVKTFLDNATDELRLAANGFIDADRKWWANFEDLRARLGLTSADELAGMRGSGLWGTNGELYARTSRRADLSEYVVRHRDGASNVKTFDNYEQYMAGATGDFADPMGEMQLALYDAGSKQAYRSFTRSYNALTGSLAVKVSGEDVEFHNKMQKNLESTYFKSSETFLKGMVEETQTKGVVEDVVKNLRAKNKTYSDMAKATAAMKTATKNMEKKLDAVTSKNAGKYIAYLGTEDTNALWDDFYNITVRDLMLDGEQLIPTKTKRYIYAKARDLGLTSYADTPETISLYSSERARLSKRYVKSRGERFTNKSGYRLFAEENLSPNPDAGTFEELMVLDQIRPGGNIDWYNGMIRNGQFGSDDSAREMLAAIKQNFGDIGVDRGVADAMGVQDWDDFYAVMDETIIDDAKLENLVRNGNYTLNKPTILYKGIGSEGNKINKSSNLDWLKGGEYSDPSYQFVTLDEEATGRYFGDGDKYILRYHLPEGQGVFYFDRIGRGQNDGGAFVLPPLGTTEVVRTGEKAKNGAEYVDILVRGNVDTSNNTLIGTYDAVNRALTGAAAPDPSFETSIKRSIMSANEDIINDTRVQNALTERRKILNTLRNENFYREKEAELKFLEGQYNITKEELSVAGGATVRGYIESMTRKGTAQRTAIDELCKFYGLEGDENAIEYFALSAFMEKEGKYKKEIYDQLKTAIEADHPELKFKKASGNKNQAEKVATIITDGIDAIIKEEFNDARLIVSELNPAATRKANEKVMKEVDDIAKKIEDAKANQYAGEKNIIAMRNTQGQVEYYQADPLLARLVNFEYKPQKMNGLTQAIYNTNYLWAKLFRLGTTAINLKSMISQSFHDPINMFVGGGAYRTTQQVMDDIVDVAGDDVVAWLKTYEPEALGRLQRRASETGESLQKLAVEREFELGRSIAPGATETSMYRSLATAKRARFNGANDFYDDTAGDKFVRGLDWFGEKAGKANEWRETTLRNLSYQNGLAKALKRGYSLDQARTYAAFVMNEATTNFTRMTGHLVSLKDTVPYFGSAINGTKSFYKLLSMDPVGVVGRLTGGIIIPAMALTAHSLMAEENREVYKNIPEYQKEDALVFVVNGQIFSIPIPQELGVFIAPFRQTVEGMNGVTTNTFAQFAWNDILGFSPVDLAGFADLDFAKLEQSSPGFLDRINRGITRLWSQLAPAPLKSGLEIVTGVDPYTGKLIDKSYLDYDENGNPIVKDSQSGELAKLLNNMFRSWGLSSSAPVVQNILSNIIGQGSIDMLDFLVSLGTQVPNGGWAFSATERALAQGEGYNPLYVLGTRLTDPITVAKYDEAQSAWKTEVSKLYNMKAEILRSDAWQEYLEAKRSTKDPEKLKNINSSKKDLVENYFNAIKTSVENLQKNYGAQFTAAKYATVLSLMTMDEQTLDAGAYGDYLNKEDYKTARAQAIQTMINLGFPSSSDTDILGTFVTGNDGNIKVKTYSPLAVLQLDDISGAAISSQTNRQHEAVIRSLVTDAGLFDQRSNYQKKVSAAIKQKNSAEAEKLINEYNEKVIRAVGAYIQQYTPESVLRGDTLTFLKEYIMVPYDFQVNKYGKHVAGLGNDAYLSDAFKEPYLKYIFNYGDNKL